MTIIKFTLEILIYLFIYLLFLQHVVNVFLFLPLINVADATPSPTYVVTTWSRVGYARETNMDYIVNYLFHDRE